MPQEKDRVGVLVGRGKERDHLEMVVAFSERENAPKLGSFLVIEEQEFKKRKFLARVEDMNYGDFQATKDERIRAIVEKYMREIGGYARELSEEEKKTLFFRHYILKVVAEIGTTKADPETGSQPSEILAEYRLLPELSSICRVPSNDEYSTITNAGIQEPSTAMRVGKLALGSEERDNEILFEPWKFEKRRTAIFARTGYGKSNLCKVVVSLASLRGKAGMLVLDMDGEYALETKTATGQPVLGLADIPELKGNLAVYTQRRDVLRAYEDVYICPLLNLELLGPFEVAELCADQELAIIAEFRYGDEGRWREFLRDYRGEQKAKDKRKKLLEYCGQVSTKKDKEKPDAKQQYALCRNLRDVLEWDEPTAPNILEDVKFHLGMKRVVILDLSLMTLNVAYRVAHLVLDALFRYNVESITTAKTIGTIAVFEEAQNVLNKKAVEEGTSIFSRWAKEGRKFDLGLIYVTQQPGAIAEEIVSQTDNFFVMHLLCRGDIDALKRANPHYDGVIADFLAMETLVGNTYIYSAPLQPYVFPAKVLKFSKDLFQRLPPETQPEQGVLEQLKAMASHVKPLAEKGDWKWPKFVGACSREIYRYLNQAGISSPFMDHDKKWIDYAVAEHLLSVLDARGLLKLPQPLQETPAQPSDAEAANGQ